MLKGVEGQALLLTTELYIKSLNSSAAGEIGQSIDAVYFAIGCLRASNSHLTMPLLKAYFPSFPTPRSYVTVRPVLSQNDIRKAL